LIQTPSKLVEAPPAPEPPTPAHNKLAQIQGDEDKCEDNNKNCHSWALHGQGYGTEGCDANEAYMHTNCRLSCKICVPNMKPFNFKALTDAQEDAGDYTPGYKDCQAKDPANSMHYVPCRGLKAADLSGCCNGVKAGATWCAAQKVGQVEYAADEDLGGCIYKMNQFFTSDVTTLKFT